MKPAVPLRSLATVWTSSVDKHSRDGELPVRLCNYVDAYKNDKVRPSPDLMKATATADEIQRNRLHQGDTVFTKDSENPNDIGISAYIDGEAADFVCGYHLAIARPLDHVWPRYVTWALRSRPALDHFANAARGISRYGLGLADIRSVPVPGWAPDEQRRIADFLDDRVALIDQLIAAREAQKGIVEQHHRATCAVLTTTGRGQDTDLTDVPWMPSKRVGAVLWRVGQAFTTGSGTTPKSDQLDYYDGSVPWITTSELRDQSIRHAARGVSKSALVDYSALHVFEPGTLLVAMYGATVGRLGMLDIAACVNQACCALVPRGPVSAEYAFFWFYAHRQHIMTLASGGGQPNISQDLVRSLRIPAPDRKAQKQVVAELEQSARSSNEGTKALDRAIALLQEYKQSLITAAVTGEFDVTTASTRIPGES